MDLADLSVRVGQVVLEGQADLVDPVDQAALEDRVDHRGQAALEDLADQAGLLVQVALEDQQGFPDHLDLKDPSLVHQAGQVD